MSNPAIPRDDVHRLAEACADAGEQFTPTATRLIRGQRRLMRFITDNAASLGEQEAQMALHMTSVCLRIFEQVGGRMQKVAGRDLDQAAARIGGEVENLLPFDASLPERARGVEWRAQPHLLDEILWALYEKEEREEGELEVPPDRAALVYLAMWAAVEAMDARWQPPADYTGQPLTASE